MRRRRERVADDQERYVLRVCVGEDVIAVAFDRLPIGNYNRSAVI